jgi:hypothetical protein
MAAREYFFRRTFYATAPLLLWAVHFFGAYVFTAMSCASELADAMWHGRSVIAWVLVVWTALAIVLAICLLWRALIDYRKSRAALMNGARIGCALLGAIGIAWTAMPLFILSVCTK